MKYNASVDREMVEAVEGVWNDHCFGYENWGAGAGTAEYSFRSEEDRDKAAKLIESFTKPYCFETEWNGEYYEVVDKGIDIDRVINELARLKAVDKELAAEYKSIGDALMRIKQKLYMGAN